jgi:heme/copper-type cytochrome/quinol oxidase subunit 2
MKQRMLAVILVAAAASLAIVPAPSPSDDGPEQVVPISASQYAFDPAEITVQAGQRVFLEISSTDVVHGIYIDGYELQATADVGRIQTLEFKADSPGTYTFRCSVTCGPLHPFMVGKLHVVPDYKWIRLIGGSALAVMAGMIWSQKREIQTNA